MPGIDKTKLDRYRKGELKFMDVFGINGTQLGAVLRCGYNFFAEGRLEEAQKIFEGLSVMDPNHPYIQTMLGAVYQKKGEYDRAIARYTVALKLYPKDVSALTNRGEIYLLLGKFTEAAEDFSKVLQQGSTNPFAQRARLLSIVAAESLQSVRKSPK